MGDVAQHKDTMSMNPLKTLIVLFGVTVSLCLAEKEGPLELEGAWAAHIPKTVIGTGESLVYVIRKAGGKLHIYEIKSDRRSIAVNEEMQHVFRTETVERGPYILRFHREKMTIRFKDGRGGAKEFKVEPRKANWVLTDEAKVYSRLPAKYLPFFKGLAVKDVGSQ
jgi:hypothetical protein